MKGIFLGTGTSLPNARRKPPGMILMEKGTTVLIDSGPTALYTAAEAGVFPGEIRRLFYTHLHPDHTLGYIALLFALHNAAYATREALDVFGPKGFQNFHNKVVSLYGKWVEPSSFSFSIRELEEETFDLPEYTVETRKTKHSPESIGFRFSTPSGKIFAVSGDTGYSSDLVELGRDADVLVLECAFPDGKETPGHLTPSLAGKIGQEAGCKTLYLTHFYPPCEEVDLVTQCSREYKGKIIVAEDLDEFSL